MSDIVVSVENLSKIYRLGQIGTGTFRNDVQVWWARRRGKPNPLLKIGQVDHGNQSGETIWALKDVSFSVEQGEVLGIIGRNGAGKSTLLKILSRVTAPTDGKIKVKGRVASLLEVGTGFHPELTGRENIYLNGAILGMTRREVERKFDEIVDFSGVEQFIDTPVKRYSSGMYVRLAFAVAAHLDPEILVVDEVLAVGDAEFQKKCLGKMGEVAKRGRTVLFVSHNMAAILNLCPKSIYLCKGEVSGTGASDTIIENYLSSNVKIDKNFIDYRPNWAKPFITSLRILDVNGYERNSLPMGSDVIFEMQFRCPPGIKIARPIMGVVVNHITRGAVGGVNMRMTTVAEKEKNISSATIQCIIPKIPLIQGHYVADFWLGDGSIDVDSIIGYLKFSITENDIFGTGKLPYEHIGVVYFRPEWRIYVNE